MAVLGGTSSCTVADAGTLDDDPPAHEVLAGVYDAMLRPNDTGVPVSMKRRDIRCGGVSALTARSVQLGNQSCR